MYTSLGAVEIAQFRASGAARYCLGLRGELAADWADFITVASIQYVDDDQFGPSTVLTLDVIDQSQLLGVLVLLTNWGATLLWMQCVSVYPPQAASAP